MYSVSDLQKLAQMLAFLGIPFSGTVAIGGGASRPGSPQLYELWWDTSLGGLGQLVCAVQITPTVIWSNVAGIQV